MFGLISLSNLKKGKPAGLSPKQIVSGVVNLMDARKNLNSNEYAHVYMIYTEICKHKEKILFKNFFDYSDYLLEAIVSQFDIVVPYYQICGNQQFKETVNFTQENMKKVYRKQAQEHLALNGYRFKDDNQWIELVKRFVQEFN